MASESLPADDVTCPFADKELVGAVPLLVAGWLRQAEVAFSVYNSQNMVALKLLRSMSVRCCHGSLCIPVSLSDFVVYVCVGCRSVAYGYSCVQSRLDLFRGTTAQVRGHF